MSNKAFTFSELLVSLAVLGLIAAFVISPIINSISNLTRKSILKEAYSVGSDQFYKAFTEGRIKASTGLDAASEIIPNINFT